MEISGWIIYLISIADTVDKTFKIMVGLGIGSWFLCLLISAILAEAEDLEETEIKGLVKTCKIGLFVFIFGVIGSIFTPSSKAVAAIYVIPKIVNNETLQAEANEFYLMAKEWLKTTLEDKPNKLTDDEKRESRKRSTEKEKVEKTTTENTDV